MFTLPDIPGRYPVGATTFAIPLDAPETIGTAKLRHTSGNTPREPALLLEEVVFTAFYPADLSVPSADGTPPDKLKKAMDWVPKPVKETIRGYAHFAKLPFWLSEVFMRAVASRLKIPVYPNASLLDPADSSHDPDAQWPLVYFSHGLSGTRTTYSHLCIRLASQGRVVLAMEHRDGTAPVVTSHFAPVSHKGRKKRRPKVKYYLHPEDVLYDDGERQQSKFAFRTDQLLFRRIELYLSHMGFSEFVNAHPRVESEKSLLKGIYIVNGYKCHEISRHGVFWHSWTAGRVRCREDIAYLGHSFGGALVLSVLSNPPPTLTLPNGQPGARLEALPITHALVLDPWLEPLAYPGPAPHVEATRDARAPAILVLNSEEFTLWRDHFERLQSVVRAWRQDIKEVLTSAGTGTGTGTGDAGVDANANVDQEAPALATPVKLLTLVHAKHVSFSDFGVIWPLGHPSRGGRLILKTVGDLAEAFLRDDVRRATQKLPRREMEVVHTAKGTLNSAPPARRTRKLAGHVGDIIVH